MSDQAQNSRLSKTQTNACVQLGISLAKIHKRLIAEGYIIKNGKITPPPPQHSAKIHV
jgi:hypothetical protein